MSKEEKNPTPYQWDFDGACKPTGQHHFASQKTFSLGIFQWIPKTGGKGLKRSAAKLRVKGDYNSPEIALAKAKAICEERNAKRIGYPDGE